MKRNLLLTPGPTQLPYEVRETLARPISLVDEVMNTT